MNEEFSFNFFFLSFILFTLLFSFLLLHHFELCDGHLALRKRHWAFIAAVATLSTLCKKTSFTTFIAWIMIPPHKKNIDDATIQMFYIFKGRPKEYYFCLKSLERIFLKLCSWILMIDFQRNEKMHLNLNNSPPFM